MQYIMAKRTIWKNEWLWMNSTPFYIVFKRQLSLRPMNFVTRSVLCGIFFLVSEQNFLKCIVVLYCCATVLAAQRVHGILNSNIIGRSWYMKKFNCIRIFNHFFCDVPIDAFCRWNTVTCKYSSIWKKWVPKMA